MHQAGRHGDPGTVNPADGNATLGVFNPSCYIHTGFTNDITIDGVNYKEAFRNFFYGTGVKVAPSAGPGGPGAPTILFDDCGELCNPTCDPLVPPPPPLRKMCSSGKYSDRTSEQIFTKSQLESAPVFNLCTWFFGAGTSVSMRAGSASRTRMGRSLHRYAKGPASRRHRHRRHRRPHCPAPTGAKTFSVFHLSGEKRSFAKTGSGQMNTMQEKWESIFAGVTPSTSMCPGSVRAAAFAQRAARMNTVSKGTRSSFSRLLPIFRMNVDQFAKTRSGQAFEQSKHEAHSQATIRRAAIPA